MIRRRSDIDHPLVVAMMLTVVLFYASLPVVAVLVLVAAARLAGPLVAVLVLAAAWCWWRQRRP